MELDLNQEPLDQIEERIRRLEAVIFRERQRQRWPQDHNPIQVTNFAGELVTDNNVQDEGRVQQEEVGVDREGGMEEDEKIDKRKDTYLVAKALGMETYTNDAMGCPGKYFDCNICLEIARNPVLTCCGHLYCWSCFYKLPYAYSNAKECPVCIGEVTETGIISIYGNESVNGSDQFDLKETGLEVPPRPRAPRIESIRQKIRSHRASPTIQHTLQFGTFGLGEGVQLEMPNTETDGVYFPGNESVLQQLRSRRSSAILDMLQFGTFGGESGEQVQLENPNAETNRSNFLASQSLLEAENNQHTFSHQFPRLLAPRAVLLSSLSVAMNSAMDSAERLFEEVESHANYHTLESISQLSPHTDSPFDIAATNQLESHTQGVAATTSSVSPLSRNDGISAVTDTNIQTTDSNMQIISSDPSSSGRTDVSR